MQKALEIKEKRAREESEHLAYMAKLDAMLDVERQRIQDAQTNLERGAAIRQKEHDIEKARALAEGKLVPSPQPRPQSADMSAADPSPKPTRTTSTHSKSDKPVPAPKLAESKTQAGWPRRESPAKKEWESQKKIENASNDAIDSVMDMVGLEAVKVQILRIKAKIDVSVRQNSNMKEDRLNVAFLGNPGTGMLDLKSESWRFF